MKLSRLPVCVLLAALSAGCPETSAPGPSDSSSVKTTVSGSAPAKSSAASGPTASARPTASASGGGGEKDVVSVATKDTGVAGVGFEIKGLAGQGWSVITLDGAFFAASGPPGGPLGLQIRAYDEKSGDNAKLFDALVTHKPTKAGKPEKVDLAGEPREALAFRNGEGFGTSAYCLIRLPAKAGATNGLVFLAFSGMSDKEEPTCKKALDAPALKPIVASFRLVP
jgi:hypothetical protein